MTNTFERVKRVLVATLYVEPDMVQRESHVHRDLDADSLAMVQVMMALEEEFGLTVPDEDAEALETVGQIVDYVDTKLSVLVATV